MLMPFDSKLKSEVSKFLRAGCPVPPSPGLGEKKQTDKKKFFGFAFFKVMSYEEQITTCDRRVLDLLRDALLRGGADMRTLDGAIKALDDKVKLSPDAFCMLFPDTTFGEFGIPVPQQDYFLHVCAMTAFQPFEDGNAITTDSRDVIEVLTPIYRILAVLAAITMHKTGFEGLDKIDVERILPFKPRSAFTEQRYGSLLEVAQSIWFNVCHAYTDPTADNVIRDFVCPDGQACVWLDFDTEKSLLLLRHDENGSLDDIDLAELHSLIQLKRMVKASHQQPQLAIVVNGTFVVYPERDGTVYRLPNAAEAEFLGQRGALWLESFQETPYIEFARGDASQDYFLLMTSSGGHYSSFYRNTRQMHVPKPLSAPQPVTVVAYPIYLHSLTAEQCKRVQDDADAALSRSRSTTPRAMPVAVSCVVCGTTEKFLMQNESDKRFYCGEKCVGQALRLEHARALESARQKEAAASATANKIKSPRITPVVVSAQGGGQTTARSQWK